MNENLCVSQIKQTYMDELGQTALAFIQRMDLRSFSHLLRPFSLTKPSCPSHISRKMMTWMWYVCKVKNPGHRKTLEVEAERVRWNWFDSGSYPRWHKQAAPITLNLMSPRNSAATLAFVLQLFCSLGCLDIKMHIKNWQVINIYLLTIWEWEEGEGNTRSHPVIWKVRQPLVGVLATV